MEKIGLVETIDALRTELASAVEKAQGQEIQFPIGSVQLEFQVGVTQEDQPHYLRVLARTAADASDLIAFGLGAIAARAGSGGGRGAGSNHGVVAPVRTYEAPLDRRFEEAGFGEIAMVTLLLKETLARVADPALVPAVARPWEVTRGS